MYDKETWLKSDRNYRKVDFSYWSHHSKKRNYQVGKFNFGFVRLDTSKWLLITVGKITKVPDNPGPCEYVEIEKI